MTETQENTIVKCPWCGEEIDWLIVEVQTTRDYSARLGPYGMDYDPFDGGIEPEEFEPRTYFCPECSVELADNEIDAEEFMRTGKLPPKAEPAEDKSAAEVQTP